MSLQQLTVGAFMSSPVITTRHDVPFSDATMVMAAKKIGNLVVVGENGDPLGILTERAILYYLALSKALPGMPVGRALLHKFARLQPATTIIEAAKTMIVKKTRLLVFEKGHAADRDRLAGIVTASDIMRAFAETGRNPPLAGIVRHRVFTLGPTNTILAAVKMMYKRRIGSVLIEKDGQPFGIFTERDLMSRVLAQNVDLEDKVGSYCSRPIQTARLRLGAGTAAKQMLASNIKRLPLVSGGRIAGIVTARDLVEAFQRSLA
ncbi:CBS domain-containing protein [Nitrososphaera sp.]|uniref:CBS domain-containing protein n=1 Tax=Nitrososphaera sp. TaxID=1971748 RepID=UPI00307E000C